MKETSFLFASLFVCISAIFQPIGSAAQVGINADGSQPDNSAMLDVKSTTKGFLVPRMTLGQIEEVADPANGMLVFCTSNDKFYVYLSSGNNWKEITYGSGTIAPWSCGEPYTDTRDNKSYNTVMIGTQCWMSQNLNIGTRIDVGTQQIDNGEVEKYCYGDDENNCTVYGGLYQWNEMMQYVTTEGVKGICMPGWHIPTDAEWTILTSFLGGEPVAGGKMKESGLEHWIFPNQSATNTSGFTGLPGGRRSTAGTFEYITWYGHFRSSTEFDASFAWIRTLTCWYESCDRSSSYEKAQGFSVRCLRTTE